MGNLISTELRQIMNMPNFGGFSVIHCGNTELNYIKHSFNHFKAAQNKRLPIAAVAAGKRKQTSWTYGSTLEPALRPLWRSGLRVAFL